MMEEQRAPHTVRAASDDDQRCREAQNLKVLAEFLGVPDPAVLRLQSFPASRLSVDLSQ